MLGYIISKYDYISVIEHEIQSFDILHKTYSNIFVIENGKVLYKNDIIRNAILYGHVQVLKWFKRSGYVFEYDEWDAVWASMKGHVKVLKWFKHLGYEFKYNEWAINHASENGNIHVLKWFKHSGYKFKYNKRAIIKASKIIILKFFIEIINPKKIIKWSKHAYVRTIKFKTKKRYFKGYEKN